MRDNKYYSIVNNFCHTEFDVASFDFVSFTAEYKKAFSAVCKYWFKLHRKQINCLFDELSEGNWKRLHQTKEERASFTVENALTEIQGDMLYSSDRFSWDRLARIHWWYQCLYRYVKYSDVKEI